MTISELALRRPVLAVVMNILIILFGILVPRREGLSRH